MPYIFVGIAILLGLWLAARWYVSAEPATVLRVLRWTAVVLGIGLVIAIILTEQVSWLFFLLPILLPWLIRARSAARTAHNWQRMSGGGGRSSAGQSSHVDTVYLRMFLDHVSGEMNGEVLQGRFHGRELAGMTINELLDLMGEVGGDEQSQQVLAAYLDRSHPDWRDMAQSRGTAGPSTSGTMTRDEAYEILGLEAGASPEEIKAAHHRLMAKYHPDAGGSTYLATKINQAKDLLLGE